MLVDLGNEGSMIKMKQSNLLYIVKTKIKGKKTHAKIQAGTNDGK